MVQEAIIPIIETKDLCKHFGPTVALDKVNVKILPGKITGLIGENGSGKSTISSIMAGMQPATSGELFLHGEPYHPQSMIDGAVHGIGMIVQEAGTVPGLTLAQNIFLGSEKDFCRFGLVDHRAMNKAAQQALDRIGFTRAKASDMIDILDQQERKLVEVAKVMYRNPEILVVDETTTALSQSGRDIVYRLMDEQRDAGKAVIFISHDLDEVMEHCDCLSVLRDGHLIATLEKKDFSAALVKKYMVGREIGEKYYREDYGREVSDEVVLEAENITSGLGIMTNVSLQLHKGEILGVAGLSDCGMHELGHALFGEGKLATGSVIIAFAACMVVALLLGLFKGLMAIFMHVPAFIVTIVGGSIFSALGAVLMGKETTLSLSEYFNTTADGVVITGVAMLLCFYIVALVLFNYTSFGKSAKLLGGNMRSAAQSGIKANSIMLKAFLIGGVAIGLAAIFVILQTKTVTQTTGGSLGNDMMVAVVLGGMPISGGSKSKISAAIVGAATITILNTALTVLGLTVGYIQIVRGLLFLTVVFVTSMTYRGKLLPR